MPGKRKNQGGEKTKFLKKGEGGKEGSSPEGRRSIGEKVCLERKDGKPSVYL